MDSLHLDGIHLILSSLLGLVTAFGIILNRILVNRARMLQIELTHKAEADQNEFNELAMIRRELQIGLERSRRDIEKLRHDIDEWQARYYMLEQRHMKEIFDLRTEMQGNFDLN